MKRGERIAKKTKSTIKRVLLELIQKKNYPDITVSEITEKGNIGRSTLYKHYQSKADVLVDIHKDMFENLFSGLSTPEPWLAPEPPSELFLFFKRYQTLGKNPFSLSYKLGSDLDYLINNINFQLTVVIEERLRNAFSGRNITIPFPFLAQSISSLYSGLIMSWFSEYQSSESHQFATNIHRMTRALVYEVIGKTPQNKTDSAEAKSRAAD